MADSTQPWTCLLFFLLSLQIPLSLASPQNIETFYPSPSPPPPPPPPPNDSPPPIFISPAIQPPQSPPPKPSGNGNKIAKAVAATAASTLVVTALAFLLIQRYMVAKRKREKIDGAAAAAAAAGGSGGGGGGGRPLPLQSRSTYVRYQGDVKGFIVDENGLDVLYWRKLERRNSNSPRNSHDLRKEVLKNQRGDERRKNESVQEVPLLRGKSSSSHVKVLPKNDDIRDQVNDVIRAYGIRNDSFNSVPRQQQPKKPSAGIVFKPEPEPPSSRSSSSSSGPPLASAPPTPPPKAPPPPPPPATPFLSVPKKITAAPPPPPPPIPVNKAPAPPPAPPIPVNKAPAPPPAPPIPVNKAPAPPPAPPIPVNKAPAPPPAPPPKARSLNAVSKPPPPPPPKGKPVEKSSGEGTSGGDGGQVKLKPLHWDKVNMVNTEHSMVWDKINDGGSFRFDGDLMEALFGYVATNKKSPKGNNNNTSTNNSSQTTEAKSSSSQTFILDTRKSQNIAIVLRSLYVSRKEVIDALMEGIGLSQETLEKLSRVGPTAEEQSQILEYSGDPSRLADAESFLFHILKAVPSAFTRLNAMLFRSSYGSEIAHLKDSLQALELACGELRTRGLFVRLLEAILKAGNRMNAGTSRGNAQAFNLTSLRKLSDVKSTDGKTTLLHFVVEEVVRSEGKRCVLNRNRSLNRSTSTSRSSSTSSSSSSPLKEEREKEYVMLGLPVVGGLSSEFSSVKKAASVDYDAVSSTCSVLSKRAAEIRRLIVSQSVKGGFAKEMESFLDSVEEELRKVDQERARVLEVVSKTTEYYQAGASKDKEAHPFQLFVIVKDFLVMVDKVCVEIARNLQRKRGGNSGSGSSPKAPPPRPEKFAARFPNLPENFMSDKSAGRSSSDESDDD